MGRVLVVDDDADFREAISRLLALEGHESALAGNGWEALLETDRDHFDLVILDMTMPGMDGPTFLEIIRAGQIGLTLPVIVVTALQRCEAELRLGHAVVQGIIEKNADLVHRLLAQVGNILGPRLGS